MHVDISSIFPNLPISQAEIDSIHLYVEKWVAGYRWREKVRHAKDVNLSDPKVRAPSPAAIAPLIVRRRLGISWMRTSGRSMSEGVSRLS